MLKFTTKKPSEALAYLRHGLVHLQLGEQNRLLKAWNLDAEQKPINAPARQLNPPCVVYKEYVQLSQGPHLGSSPRL